MFHQGASGIGLLTAGFGIGAGLGVLVLARVNQRMERGRVVQTGLALYGLLVLLLGSARTLPMMFVIMIPFGTVYLMIIATCNTTLQMTTTEAMRGRVLAFYFIAFGVFYPLGAQLQSFVADAIGLRTTIAIFGASLTVLAWVWRRGDRVALAMRAEPRTVS